MMLNPLLIMSMVGLPRLPVQYANSDTGHALELSSIDAFR